MLADSNELIGQALGTCALLKLLGRGGMGAVYLAQQSRPRRTVAVKVLMPSFVLEKRPRAEFLARFRREADAIAALDHVNIMPIYEYGEQDDIAYLVMPYVTGGTLRDILEKRGSLPLDEVVPIIEQAAAGLDCAHAQGIIHRDLKPGNILFHADGRIVLADFGLAKVLKDFTEQGGLNGENKIINATITSVGTIVGTPEYLSPEQGTGKPVDPRTDVYALGVVLFQMLAGRVPFTGTSPVAIAIKHTLEPPPPLRELNPMISPAVEAVVMKALAKDPAQRYASAGIFARTLIAAAYNSSVPLDPPVQTKMPMEPGIYGDSNNTSRQSEIELDSLAAMPTVDLTGQEVYPISAHQQAQAQRGDLAKAARIHNTATEKAPRLPVKTLTQKGEEPAAAFKFEQVERYDAVARPSGRPFPMAILGGILALLIVMGGFASYLYLGRTPQKTEVTIIKQVTTTIPTPVKSPQLPQAMVPVGQLIYATALPGAKCDNQGAQWNMTLNTKPTCNTDTLGLANTSTQRVAATFLKALPGQDQLPRDYVIQVQVTVRPDARGSFGIFFRSQPDPRQGTYVFIVSQSGWVAYSYDDITGAPSTLYGRQLQGTLNGTVTMDVVVRGNTYGLYLNGAWQGDAQSDTYLSGTMGLGADVGANVSFKNLAIYTLPYR